MSGTANYSSIAVSWLVLAGGLLLLTGGGEFLVSGAAKLARRLGMSTLLIGLTVVAFGTSMPELFVGLFALAQDHPDILTGNAVGSNIANIGLILGLCAMITPLPVRYRHVSLELYFMLGATVMVLLAAWNGFFPRFLGLLFVASLVLYTVRSFRLATGKNRKAPPKGNAVPEKVQKRLLPGIGLTAAGLFCLPLGSIFFIRGAVDVARYFGVSELVIGLTLAAVGTSLPELASCLAAIRQRQTQILAGNVIGSNLFNPLMVLGACSILKPYPMSPELLTRDVPVMFSFSAVLVPLLAVQQGLRRLHGLMLLAAYIAYLFFLR